MRKRSRSLLYPNRRNHLCSRADHVKENGLTYPSPGISNGIKLSPQETRPSSPAALPVASEKVRDLRVLECGDGRTKTKLAKLGDAGRLLSVVSLAWKITRNTIGVVQPKEGAG